ncbi:MAG: hypothetical protein M3384_13340 [Acidobacteriota bacterium]|nr:hypothetical protein [Acidobacteriota bacterium]
MKFISLAIIFALFANICFSQSNQLHKSQKSRISTVKKNILIDKKLPSLYITFEKFGKWTPLRDDESGKGVLLRLHNNMRYSINVCGFGIQNENGQFTQYSEGSLLGLQYDVILNPLTITEDRPNIDVPTGYNTGSTCQLFEVRPGKLMRFAVPKEHLVKGLSIKIPFIYEWEDVGEPNHFVYFNSLNIPN